MDRQRNDRAIPLCDRTRSVALSAMEAWGEDVYLVTFSNSKTHDANRARDQRRNAKITMKVGIPKSSGRRDCNRAAFRVTIVIVLLDPSRPARGCLPEFCGHRVFPPPKERRPQRQPAAPGIARFAELPCQYASERVESATR